MAIAPLVTITTERLSARSAATSPAMRGIISASLASMREPIFTTIRRACESSFRAFTPAPIARPTRAGVPLRGFAGRLLGLGVLRSRWFFHGQKALELLGVGVGERGGELSNP